MPVDYRNYPPNWFTEIRPRILVRADNCCETCGVENKAKLFSVPLKVKNTDGRYSKRSLWIESETDKNRLVANFSLAGKIKVVTVVLTIAHLDHDPKNHKVKDDRLKALCQQCHKVYDLKTGAEK